MVIVVQDEVRAQAWPMAGVFLSLHWMYLFRLGTQPNKSIVSLVGALNSGAGRAGRDWGCLLCPLLKGRQG